MARSEKRARRLATAAMAGLLLAGAYLFWELFELRFQAGDVYPPYSTLRADPLGSKALYEALAETGRIEVSRNLRPLDRVHGLEGATLLLLGWPAAGRLPPNIQTLVENGGRLVLAFPPIHNNRDLRGPLKPADGEEEGPRPDEDWIPLEKWGLRVSVAPLPASSGRYLESLAILQGDAPLPRSLPWHSAAVLDLLDPSWKAVYSRGADPVVAERSFGAGRVVVATDSFLFSNEALRRERHADFLAWVLGDGKRLVFDEGHLGVTEDPGIATLLRRYGLTGVAAVLLVLAVLFAWRGATSFPPRLMEEEESLGPLVAGKDSASALVNLLRRGIPGARLLPECLAIWEKSLDGTRAASPERLARVRAAMAAHQAAPPRSRDAVKTYQEVRRILDRKQGGSKEILDSVQENEAHHGDTEARRAFLS